MKADQQTKDFVDFLVGAWGSGLPEQAAPQKEKTWMDGRRKRPDDDLTWSVD